ncbi:MAG: formate dehydrogenase alpha subunit [Acidimicrobiaceae bacterium]|nr:MAG: formate dehydrogenase alpha subunit [Acidimicrobiaceae bacterium]
MTDVPVPDPTRLVELTIDGKVVQVPEGTTLLQACRGAGCPEIPTLCYGDTLTPKNACRVCMVEVEGSRTLVPSCSRKVDPGMVVHTSNERVEHSRKMVLEFLGSSTDLSTAPNVEGWNDRYAVDLDRYGADRRTQAQPVKRDNDLYVRDYEKCILCYKCVDACGEQWQNTFAIAVAGRGFSSHIAAELLRKLHRCVPDRRIDVHHRTRHARRGNLARGHPDRHRHHLPVLRRRVPAQPARAGQRDRQGDESERPLGHPRQPVHQGPLRLPARAEPLTTRRRSLHGAVRTLITSCRSGDHHCRRLAKIIRERVDQPVVHRVDRAVQRWRRTLPVDVPSSGMPSITAASCSHARRAAAVSRR